MRTMAPGRRTGVVAVLRSMVWGSRGVSRPHLRRRVVVVVVEFDWSSRALLWSSTTKVWRRGGSEGRRTKRTVQ
jgi:hypothetical protein